MFQRRLLLSSFIVPGLFIGCDAYRSEEPIDAPIPVAEPQAAPSPSKSKSPAAPGPAEREFQGIRFSIPSGWREVELTPIQQSILDARFVIQAAGGEAQLTLSSVGGGIEANIARWTQEVDSPAGESPVVETAAVDGVETTWIDLRGTYRSAVSHDPGPHANWRVLGVAIPRSPRDYYIKLIGPRDTVAEIHDEFRQFVKGCRITR